MQKRVFESIFISIVCMTSNRGWYQTFLCIKWHFQMKYLMLVIELSHILSWCDRNLSNYNRISWLGCQRDAHAWCSITVICFVLPVFWVFISQHVLLHSFCPSIYSLSLVILIIYLQVVTAKFCMFFTMSLEFIL